MDKSSDLVTPSPATRPLYILISYLISPPCCRELWARCRKTEDHDLHEASNSEFLTIQTDLKILDNKDLDLDGNFNIGPFLGRDIAFCEDLICFIRYRSARVSIFCAWVLKLPFSFHFVISELL